MSASPDLERRIRAALQDTAREVSDESVSPPPDLLHRRRTGSGSRRWMAPALAAAMVLVLVGVVGAISARPDSHRDRDVPMHVGAESSIDGSWVLAEADSGGRPVRLPVSPAVRLTADGGSILIDDGVNTTTVSARFDDKGRLLAHFVSVTYVLDPRSNVAGGRELLALLDSIAPGADPEKVTSSEVTVDQDRLSITTSVGRLVFTRTSRPAGAPDGPGGTSSTPTGTAESGN